MGGPKDSRSGRGVTKTRRKIIGLKNIREKTGKKYEQKQSPKK